MWLIILIPSRIEIVEGIWCEAARDHRPRGRDTVVRGDGFGARISAVARDRQMAGTYTGSLLLTDTSRHAYIHGRQDRHGGFRPSIRLWRSYKGRRRNDDASLVMPKREFVKVPSDSSRLTRTALWETKREHTLLTVSLFALYTK